MIRASRAASAGALLRQVSPSGWWVAFAVACAFSFSGLFNHPLRASDEPRVAGIAAEMADSRDFLVPHLGGEAFLEHPPLFYALLAGDLALLGKTDGVARIPGALAAFCTLLLLFDLAKRMAGIGAGWMAILVLCTTHVYFKWSHRVVVDPLLTLFVTLGYWAYARLAYERAPGGAPRAGLVGIGYLAGVLAFLTKGPVGVVLLGAPIGLDVALRRHGWLLRSRAHLAGALLLVLGCALWPALLFLVAGRETFDAFFVQNVIGRVLPGVAGYRGGHERPFWFYLAGLPSHLGLWLPALPAVYHWLHRRQLPDGWNAPMIRFAAFVPATGLLILSLAATKRGVYLLPLVPMLAAAIGCWIAATAIQPAKGFLERAVVAGYSAIVAFLARPFERRAKAFGGSSSGRARMRRIVPRGVPDGDSLPIVAWLAFAVALAWNTIALGQPDEGRDLGPVAHEIMALRSPGRALVGFDLHEEMRGALSFYTGEAIPNARTLEELRCLLADDPAALVLYGRTQAAHPGFVLSQAFPAYAQLHRWPMAEGDYTLYAPSELRALGEGKPAPGGSGPSDSSPSPRDCAGARGRTPVRDAASQARPALPTRSSS